MAELEKITTANALLVTESETDFFNDAVTQYNKHNDSRITVTLYKKNEQTGDQIFTVAGLTMLSDILEIGKRMQVLKITRGDYYE